MAINVGDAVVKLGLDKTQFNQGMNQVATETEKSAKRMQNGMRIAAVAITAVGVAGLKLVADAKKLNAQLGQIALTTGSTTAEMRDLALELSNVTFRLNSVLNTLALLAQAGVITEEDLKAHANAFDALGDAIGLSAEVVAETLIPAYQFFGKELPRTAKELDIFTWLQHKSILGFKDLAPVMGYVAAYGQDLDLTFEDLISTMVILSEQGAKGADITRMFRTAITQAANEGISLNEALGITNEKLTEYNERIGVECVEMTQAYADVANEQYGIMDKLKSSWEDLTLKMGSMLEPLEPVFALFTALGPVLLALSITTIPQLVANLKTSILWLGKWVIMAGKAVVANAALAAAKIWAWAGGIPFAGIAIAIAGTVALAASIIAVRNKVMAMAEGGIVTQPTRALIGEAGPEAVIPLSKMGMGTKEIHLHIGNYLGDEMSRHQLMRDLKKLIQEDDRRNAFGQVNTGYYFGRSSR